jgi:hypothetical protein
VTYVFALLAGIVGAALGALAGAVIAGALASVLGVSNFEGESGYFAVFLGGPAGGALGLVAGATFVLRRSGHHGLVAIGPRLVAIFAGVIGVGGALLAIFWFMRPIINAGGMPPQLVFEIRLPTSSNGDPTKSTVELQTSQNRMPGTVAEVRREEGRSIMTGRVEMYYRTWQRTLVLTLPDKTDVLFDIQLGLSPPHAKAFGAWQQAHYVAEPGKEQARPANAADGYEIRYRAEWAGED